MPSEVVFAPVSTEPTYRRVASAISARIVDRTLERGMALPSELDLAQQLGVNRSTVREALRELESTGLIARGKGTRRMVVAEPGGDALADRIGQALLLSDVTVVQVWEALMVLQPPIAQAAAERRTAADLATITEAAASYERDQSEPAAAMAAIAGFFSAVASATHNPVLVLCQAPTLQVLVSSLELLLDRVPQARARVGDAQTHLVAAIRDQDAGLARLWMERHIRDFRRGFVLAGIDLDYRLAPTPRR